MSEIPNRGAECPSRRTEMLVSGATIERARQRRVALRQFMDRNGLTRAELARRAGLSNGNAITNFLNGRTESLAVRTLEKIARAYPGTTLEELTNGIALVRVGRVDNMPPPARAVLRLDLAPLLDVIRGQAGRPTTIAIEGTVSLSWPRDAADPPS